MISMVEVERRFKVVEYVTDNFVLAKEYHNYPKR